MTRPDYSIEIGFNAGPLTALASISWTDVTSYVWLEQSPITITHGRSTERDKIEAGRCSFVLRDPDRRFDPSYEIGPYYPYVRPRARIRVRARWPRTSGTWYSLFTGYIEEWEPYTPPGIRTGASRLRCVDAFSILSRETFTSLGGGGGEGTANAINNILNLTGWPAADRSINTSSTTTLPARTYDNAATLGALQAIELADNATLYINPAGQVTWHDRHWRLRNRTVLATFGDETNRVNGWILGDPVNSILGRTTIPRPAGWVSGTVNELPYTDVKFRMGDRDIRNSVRMTRSGGTEQAVEDADSQALYDIMDYSESGLLLETDGEALSRANWFLGRYKEPLMRVDQLVTNGELDPTNLWPHLLQRDLDDLVRVCRRALFAGGGAITADNRIEFVQHVIAREKWETMYKLSPENLNNYWILGDPIYGVLGLTTRLAY